ncbi:hypothetical protein IFM89_022424 [Coptis chinensis]|uniref:Uncharacterized protein n=1 Tax=Coptis chinensis TaxID=261450 RepID=A0A835I0Q7_9MAGN|nr:hypothetical protein IFM89_022424 [Coptis chinensis]
MARVIQACQAVAIRSCKEYEGDYLDVAKKPMWADDEDDALQAGFSSRTSNRGFVLLGWAPYLYIFAHPSIGGSLFHSGMGLNHRDTPAWSHPSGAAFSG